jgi:hypothetical protein
MGRREEGLTYQGPLQKGVLIFSTALEANYYGPTGAFFGSGSIRNPGALTPILFPHAGVVQTENG